MPGFFCSGRETQHTQQLKAILFCLWAYRLFLKLCGWDGDNFRGVRNWIFGSFGKWWKICRWWSDDLRYVVPLTCSKATIYRQVWKSVIFTILDASSPKKHTKISPQVQRQRKFGLTHTEVHHLASIAHCQLGTIVQTLLSITVLIGSTISSPAISYYGHINFSSLSI